MKIINTFNAQRFTLNGIQFYKNYISEVAGESISIFNAYDRKDVKVDFTNFANINLNGVIYPNVADLQSALLPVIYTRSSLSPGGSFDLTVGESNVNAFENIAKISFEGATVTEPSLGQVLVTIEGDGNQNLLQVLEVDAVFEITAPNNEMLLYQAPFYNANTNEVLEELIIDFESASVRNVTEKKARSGSFYFSNEHTDKTTELPILRKTTILELLLGVFSVKQSIWDINITGFHEIKLDPVLNREATFKTNSAKETGTYILATTDDIDDALEGLKRKQPVRLATTGNITLSGHQIIDDEITVDGDRVLVKDQNSAWNNGVYIAAAGAWQRAPDANTATELANALVTVLDGTANKQSTFRQINTSIVMGNSMVIFEPFGSSTPDATASTKGKARLYQVLGQQIDGGITPKAIQDEFEEYNKNCTRYLISELAVQSGTAALLSINGANATSSTGIVQNTATTAVNAYQAIPRVNIQTTAVAGAVAFYRTSRNILFLKDDFFIETWVGIEAILASNRFFFGLSAASSVNPTNVAPDSIINQVSFTKMASSNNLQILHNDNIGIATAINLGADFDFTTAESSFYLRLESNGTTLKYIACRLNSNLNQTHKTTGTISTDLPANTLELFHRLWLTNNTDAVVSNIGWRGMKYGKLLK